jgi:adenylate cyclase class IV
MNRNDQELEVKFYLSRGGEMEAKILSLGGKLGDPRVHEINLRFDTPDQSLLETGRLLRLRMDRRARLTYKGTGDEQSGARLRESSIHRFVIYGPQAVRSAWLPGDDDV